MLIPSELTTATHNLYEVMKRCTNTKEVKSLEIAIALLNSLVYDIEKCPICNGEMSEEQVGYVFIESDEIVYFSYCKSCEYMVAHF